MALSQPATNVSTPAAATVAWGPGQPRSGLLPTARASRMHAGLAAAWCASRSFCRFLSMGSCTTPQQEPQLRCTCRARWTGAYRASHVARIDAIVASSCRLTSGGAWCSRQWLPCHSSAHEASCCVCIVGEQPRRGRHMSTAALERQAASRLEPRGRARTQELLVCAPRRRHSAAPGLRALLRVRLHAREHGVHEG